MSRLLLSILALFAVTFLIAPSLVVAQQDSADEKRKAAEKAQAESAKRMGQGMFLSQLQSIAYNKSLANDLELVDEQLEQIKPLIKEYQSLQRELMTSNRDRSKKIQELYAEGKHEEARELGNEFQKRWSDLITENVTKLEDVLLPHQVKRVQQISRQQSVKMRRQYHGFLGLPLSMASELGLSGDERKSLEEVTREADQELREEIQKLTKKKMDKILNKLPKAKRDQYKELVGEIYDTDAAMRQMRSRSFGPQDKKKKEDKAE